MDHHQHGSMLGMSAGASTTSSSASTMDMGSSGGGGIAMTFFQSTSTRLLFYGTAPQTPGQYTGACLALALLAVLACALSSLKAVLQRGVWVPAPRRAAEESLLDVDEKTAAAKAGQYLSFRVGGSSKVGPLQTEMRKWWVAWRGMALAQRAGMAGFEVLIVGLGYSICCKLWSFFFLSFYVPSVVLMDWLTLVPSKR
jgi:hypothetical protein